MVELKSIRVREISTSSISVQWSIESTQEDLSNIAFVVFRSNSPSGGFKAVSGYLGANSSQVSSDFLKISYMFVDDKVNLHSKFRKFWYKVCAVDVSGATGTVEFDPRALLSTEDPI